MHQSLHTCQPCLNGVKVRRITIKQITVRFAPLAEDKAVDLYVLERAMSSAHAGQAGALFDKVLAAYKAASKQWSATLNRFADVRMRGRKRSMVG